MRHAMQGEHWLAAMKGHDLQQEDAEADRKRLLLERFQREVRPGRCCERLGWNGLIAPLSMQLAA